MKNYSKLFLTALMILTALTSVKAIAPGNDNFANAQTLASSQTGFALGNNTDATQETDEPSHYTMSTDKKSVWYKWVAPATRSMAFEVTDENFTSAFAIYTSTSANPTFAQLTKVQSNADLSGYMYQGSRINFWATAGKTYYIAVDWSNAVPGENHTGAFTIKYFPNKFAYSSRYDARNQRTSINVYRPETNMWYFLWNVYSINYETLFGNPGDKPMPADYDGDGRTDIAVVRDQNGSKVWYVSFLSQTIWGLPGDQALTGDFDGDGRADLVALRPTPQNFVWYVRRSTDGSMLTFTWGIPGEDKPVIGDYDGDGRTDVAIVRSENGMKIWYILKSNNGAYDQYTVEQFGLDGDTVVAEDFDGDGKTDVAVWRVSDGNWYIHRSQTNEVSVAPFGMLGDKPQPADYDLDGKADLAVFRPAEGKWYFWLSGTNTAKTVKYGIETDIPMSSMNSLVQ